MLDGGPVRTSGRADRGSAERQQPTRWKQQPVEPQQDRDEPRPPQAPVSRHVPVKDGPSSWFKRPIAILIIVIILGIAGWFGWTQLRGSATAIDSSKYQSVFFTNGNVYFGKLKSFNSEYYKMTSVYYPQTQTQTQADEKTDTQQSPDNQDNITLLKLSDAVHGPEDTMMIAKDQVLFYQNLKTDSKVAKLIEGQTSDK